MDLLTLKEFQAKLRAAGKLWSCFDGKRIYVTIRQGKLKTVRVASDRRYFVTRETLHDYLYAGPVTLHDFDEILKKVYEPTVEKYGGIYADIR